MANGIEDRGGLGTASVRPALDPWAAAVAAFLDDLLDRRRDLHDGQPDHDTDDPGPRARLRRGVPVELADLPLAAERALARVSRPTHEAGVAYPSIAKALHDVVIVEVLADRLAARSSADVDLDTVAGLIAATIAYLSDLATTRYEGSPVTHGLVIAADDRGHDPASPPIRYPGRLPTRKRTPLLFDGTDSVLVVLPSGDVLGGFTQGTVPPEPDAGRRVQLFADLAGLDGTLTAATSAAFRGIGFYLRSDRSLWVFENGTPLFIHRTGRWRSIAMQTFVESLSYWGDIDGSIAERVARAALRLSIQGQGGLLAVADDPPAVRRQLEPDDDRVDAHHRHRADDELGRLIPSDGPPSSNLIARLARIDGATILDRSGQLLAYGAIVHSSPSGGQGARTAAARSLSHGARFALSVSQDGPITVFAKGEPVLDLL